MSNVTPFAALRPKPELAGCVCELPYDVMSSEEARALAKDKPLSFLHVSKPEIDLPPGTDLYSPAVYAKGKENYDRLIDQGGLAAGRAAQFLPLPPGDGQTQPGGTGRRLRDVALEQYLHALISPWVFEGISLTACDSPSSVWGR